jgi:two-component system, chemotaxis family, sensor histidine kinase and response regulator PixL
MSLTKEREIQMQFLEEATEHLNTLESVLLEVKNSRHIDIKKINSALRAAHSMKGGAAIMGFRHISELSHRLEDNLKVLKAQKNSLEVNIELQSLLLSAVDLMRQIVEKEVLKIPVGDDWLVKNCYPIFEKLHHALGDAPSEDASSILSPEDGIENIIPLLFQTEVENSLKRLESLLTEGDTSGLAEEISIMAAEFGGLGEMLSIEKFARLCESVTQCLETSFINIQEIGQLALEAWRRSQSLILASDFENLPTSIIESEVVAVNNPIEQREIKTEEILEEILPELEPIFTEITPIISPSIKSTKLESSVLEAVTEVTISNNKTDGQENTVRVSTKQLEQINDLFGELTIQRNSLNLQVDRLQKLIRQLGKRVKTLERENHELRIAYDKASTQISGIKEIKNKVEYQKESYIQKNIFHNNFDILEMDRYNDLHLLSQAVMETIVQIQEVTTDIEISLDDTDQVTRHINKTSKQLQTELTHIRMRPLSDLVERFPRALRELCVEYGKNVQLKVEGGSTLIERNILEALNEPLMHLLRNAFDHGIEEPGVRLANGKPETAVIEIKGFNQGNRTIITIRDDGRGISLEKIRSRAFLMGLDATLLAQATDEDLLSLIFEPGFSTSDQVTALSGRGVGMDVVRNNLKQVRGDITVDTKAGQGTTFILSVPFTLSVARVLLVESNKMLMAFPTDVVTEIFLSQDEQIFSIAGSEVINWQGSMVQLIRLGRYLEFNCPRPIAQFLETPPTINAASILIINQGNQSVALQVDRCWGEIEAAIRRVEGNLSLPDGFSSCTILGDGRVVPLVNINELLYWIASTQIALNNNRLKATDNDTENLKKEVISTDEHNVVAPTFSAIASSQKGSILIVDDSINIRRFLALTLEKAGYRVEQAKDGQDALEKLQSGLEVHAMVCDIEMPRLDGYGLLVRLKSHKEFQHIPVAMLTSRSSDKHKRLAIELGAKAYFSKPYNEHELLQTLEEMIFAPFGF